VEEILQRWRKTERGPKPRLSQVQLFSALYLINEHAPLGRYDLADQIHENQGVIRGLLERLLEHHLIDSSKAGARITNEGKSALMSFLNGHRIVELKKLQIPALVRARYTFGSYLKQAGSRASRVIELRDIAVRIGALGAMTIHCTKDGLTIPPDNESLNRLYPETAAILENEFHPKAGDVILVAFAEDEYAALAGVLAVSLSVSA
jgi:uncharacterized protein DUF4443/CggR-like protein